jgi:hypothetical protein
MLMWKLCIFFVLSLPNESRAHGVCRSVAKTSEQEKLHTLASLLLHVHVHESRRSKIAIASTLIPTLLVPQAAVAIKESEQQLLSKRLGNEDPQNNYYFPMAKYRYLPRILRAWIAVDKLALPRLEKSDWQDMDEVVARLSNAIPAMKLYASSIEGSRSSKQKKKSATQKALFKYQEQYAKDCKQLEKAVEERDKEKTREALEVAKETLYDYRVLARIATEDGGVLDEDATKAKMQRDGYVAPTFAGGTPRKLKKSALYNLKKGRLVVIDPLDPAGPLQNDFDARNPKAARAELEEDLDEFKRIVPNTY